MSLRLRCLMTITWLITALLVSSCRAASPPEPESDAIGLSMHGLNYTDVPIGVFYVNKTWGGAVVPYGAGLKTAGSISLPAQWQPGIKVTVQWQDDRLYARDKDAMTTQVVEIPRYGKIYSGYLLVAFFPGRKVKVYASGVGPGHKDAPGGLKNPGKYCMEQPGCDEWYEKGANPPREGHY